MWRFLALLAKVLYPKWFPSIIILLFAYMFVLGLLGRVNAQISPATFTFTGSTRPQEGTDFRKIFAGEELKVGLMRLYPFLGIAETYTDNAFKTKTKRKNDFIHTVAPGLQAQLRLGGQHRLIVDYRASQQYSQRFSNNDVLSQDAIGLLALNFPGDLKVDLQGGHTEGYDPRGSELDIQQTDITTWNTNSFLGSMEWFGSSVGFNLTVNTLSWNFENNNQGPTRDRWSHTADFTVFGSIASKTSVLLNFNFEKENYAQNKQLDSFTYGMSTGLRWAATGKTTGIIRAGYAVLNFDRARVKQPSGSLLNSGGNKQEIFSVDGDLRWNPTTRASINIRPFRSIEQAAIFNTATFVRTGVFIRARQGIGARTNLTGTFRISQDEFEEDEDSAASNRRDLRVLGAIGFDYQAIKWLGLRVDYRFERRSSNANQFDYFANTIMLSIQGLL